MRGKSKYKKRVIKPDTKFNSTLVSQFINKVMLRGQKQTATNAVYRAIEELEKKTKTPGLEAFTAALNNVAPKVEVKSKRIGGATYQVPVEVKQNRKTTLAIRWVIEAARGTKGAPINKKLANELADAFKNEGNAMKKRETVHKMAEANKAFAHYARF